MGDDFSTLFEFLPIGAYRTRADGTQGRVNPALARLNGYASEAEMRQAVRDCGAVSYVQPGRGAEFRARLEREGRIVGFESEIHRHRTRERIWVSENAHLVRDARGEVAYCEGTVEDITDRVAAREALHRSQERMRQMFELLPGLLYRVVLLPDGQRRATYISPGARQLFGVEPDEMLADDLFMQRMRHPDDRDRIEAETRAANLAGVPLRTEYRIVLPGGEVKWVEVFSAAAPPEDGQRVRVGMVFDITARKHAEQALRDNSELWKRALESAGDGVWDWHLQDGVKLLSPRLKALYGLGADDLADTPEVLDGMTHPDDLAALVRARADHLAGRTPAYVSERRIRCKDGSWKWVLSRGIVISRDAEGRPLRMIGTHTDVTAARQAEALRHERDRAAAASQAKSQFLSRVSHELRTPLNAILGFAQLLALETPDDDRRRRWVLQVLASGQHLLELVDDILDLSSAQTGQLRVAVDVVALQPVIDEVLAMVSGSARDAGVIVFDEPPAGEAGLVRADRKRLTQIVSNLLSNAIKYNHRGGWVRVHARRVDGAVELGIADSGPGLDAGQRARLFQPFERAGAQHGPVAGTGLGLSLSRQLAEAMGGSIDLDSEPGRGSVFRLRLQAG